MAVTTTDDGREDVITHYHINDTTLSSITVSPTARIKSISSKLFVVVFICSFVRAIL